MLRIQVLIIDMVISPNSNTFSDWRRTCHSTSLCNSYNYNFFQFERISFCRLVNYSMSNSVGVYELKKKMSAKILHVGKKKWQGGFYKKKNHHLLTWILENDCLIWITWFASEYFTMRLCTYGRKSARRPPQGQRRVALLEKAIEVQHDTFSVGWTVLLAYNCTQQNTNKLIKQKLNRTD